MTTKYRWVTPTRKGSWVATSKAAREGAAKAGVAQKDDSGQVALDPLTEIVSRTRDFL